MLNRGMNIVMVACLASASGRVMAQGVGGSSPTNTSHVLTLTLSSPEVPVHWRSAIGAVNAPVAVELDPDGPAWHQHFETEPSAAFLPGNVLAVQQHLTVGGDRSWTGWHAEIADPAFAWLETPLPRLVDPFSLLVDGLPVPAQVAFSGTALHADFSPLAPGAQVVLTLKLVHVDAGPLATSFDMQQYPVPEPTTLLGLLIALLHCRSRPTPRDAQLIAR